MSLVDVFIGKYLMALRALVWRVWSLAEIFWHGDSKCFFGNLVFKNKFPT